MVWNGLISSQIKKIIISFLSRQKLWVKSQKKAYAVLNLSKQINLQVTLKVTYT